MNSKLRNIAITLLLTISAAAGAQSFGLDFLRSGVSQDLKNETVYRLVYDTLSLNFNDVLGVTPIRIDDNVTAVIRLKKGQKLTVTGAHACTREGTPTYFTPATPGIEICPKGTLIVLGEGEVVAIGGRAADGLLGETGGSAVAERGRYFRGYGGAGGAGGGGSAPGIGGRGGIGGKGGERLAMPGFEGHYDEDHKIVGTNGHDGGSGENGHDMGRLIVLGGVKIKAQQGEQGITPLLYAPRGTVDFFRCRGSKGGMGLLSNLTKVGYGGGGGNGAAGEAAQYAIGGGAPGGAGAGSGGGGGIHGEDSSSDCKYYTGQGGRGGDSNVPELAGRHGGGLPLDHTGYGGKSGSIADVKHGSHGSIYYTDAISLQAATHSAATAIKDSKDIAEIVPQNLMPYIVHTMSGDCWEKPLTYYYGQQIAETKVSPQPDKSEDVPFLGYYDKHGHRIYDHDGNADFAACDRYFRSNEDKTQWYWAAYEDVVLTPHWGEMTKVYVIHHIADPNFGGITDDPRRFEESDNMIVDYETFLDETEKIHTYHAYKNIAEGKVIIDPEQYTVDSEKKELTVPAHCTDVKTLHFFYDQKKYSIEWQFDGLDRYFSAACLNESSYTHSGKYAHGKAIIPPAFKEFQGTLISGWQAKDDNGNNIDFKGVMPTCNVKMYPIVNAVTHKATVGNCENGTVALSATEGIKYGTRIKINAVANKHYLLDKVTAIVPATNKALEIGNDTTFNMPDGDVEVKATFKYHPHGTLTVSKAAQGADTFTDNICCFVTLSGDETNTIYTNDAKALGLDESKCQPINLLEFTNGTVVNIVPVYLGDKGAREAHVYIYDDKDDKDVIDELRSRSFEFNGKEYLAYNLLIDNYSGQTDFPVQIYYEASRPSYRIQSELPEGSRITEMHTVGRDIMAKPMAYTDEMVHFTLSSDIPEIKYGDVTIEYDYGFEKRYESIMTYREDSIPSNADMAEEKGQEFFFTMPDADVVIHVSKGDQCNIETERFAYGHIQTPTSAVPGSFVPCTLTIFLNDTIEDKEREYLNLIDDVWVNGKPSEKDEPPFVSNNSKSFRWDSHNYINPDNSDDILIVKTYFKMPDGYAYVHLPGHSPDAIREVTESYRSSSNVYNIMGQKLGSSLSDIRRTHRGQIVITDGKKIMVK